MSDQNPFGAPGATAVAEPPVEETPELSGRPKPIVFIVAGAVLLVLAAAAYFLVFSGGGDTSGATGAVTPSKVHTSTAPTTKAVTPSTAPSVAVANGSTGGGTDPFRPAPQPSASASGSTSASPSSTSSAGTGSTAGVTSTLVVNSVDFAANSANVTVDGKPWIAHAGTEIFAKYYTLRVVVQGSAQCAVFTFGDLPAQLCKGQKATFTG